MWISSTPSPPLEGTALLEPAPCQGPLIPGHQPQQRGALLQETLCTRSWASGLECSLAWGNFCSYSFVLYSVACSQDGLEPHSCECGYLVKGWDDCTDSLLATPEDADKDSNFLRLKKKPEVESASPGRVIQPPTKTQELKKESTLTAI